MERTTVKSLNEMQLLASKIAKRLKGGEVLALVGSLGTGKTTFVKGLAKALGITEVVQSPTFLLMKCYPTAGAEDPTAAVKELCHVDAYRVKDEQELMKIDLGERIAHPYTVTAIEWADLVPGLIPPEAWRIKFEHGKTASERVVSILNN